MKPKFNFPFLVLNLFLICSIPIFSLRAETQVNTQEDPVQATLKAIEMAKKAVQAVEEAAQAVAQASQAIEQAKAQETMKAEDLALQEENLIKAAQMVVELSDQASKTVKKATETVLAARLVDKERMNQALAVALTEADLPWLSGVEHLQSLAFYENDLVDFIESKLLEIKKESPDIFQEMTSLIHNQKEMEAILNKVQSGKEELTDEHMISVFQAVYVSFDNINEELALLKGAIYGEPAPQFNENQKMWEKAEKMQELEDRKRDQRLERTAN